MYTYIAYVSNPSIRTLTCEIAWDVIDVASSIMFTWIRDTGICEIKKMYWNIWFRIITLKILSNVSLCLKYTYSYLCSILDQMCNSRLAQPHCRQSIFSSNSEIRHLPENTHILLFLGISPGTVLPYQPGNDRVPECIAFLHSSLKNNQESFLKIWYKNIWLVKQ